MHRLYSTSATQRHSQTSLLNLAQHRRALLDGLRQPNAATANDSFNSLHNITKRVLKSNKGTIFLPPAIFVSPQASRSLTASLVWRISCFLHYWRVPRTSLVNLEVYQSAYRLVACLLSPICRRRPNCRDLSQRNDFSACYRE